MHERMRGRQYEWIDVTVIGLSVDAAQVTKCQVFLQGREQLGNVLFEAADSNSE